MDKTEMFEMNMKGALAELAVLRETKSKNAEIYEQKMIEFNAANQGLVSSIEKTKEQTALMEDIVRSNALDHYRLNKNKHICMGVGIRVMQDVLFDDDLALAWSMEHKVALRLDIPMFKKIAKAQPIDFVTIEDRPIATIPSNIGVD